MHILHLLQKETVRFFVQHRIDKCLKISYIGTAEVKHDHPKKTLIQAGRKGFENIHANSEYVDKETVKYTYRERQENRQQYNVLVLC